MKSKATRKLATLLAWLAGVAASAESYYPAVENSLRQFPPGSIDRIPREGAPLSGTLRVETVEHITFKPAATIKFETFVPAASQPGTFTPVPLKLDLEQIPKPNPAPSHFGFELKLGTSTFSSVEDIVRVITPSG
ncbi:MAG TPA: hypothetical protein VIO38_00360 [Rariglobus sp.]